MKRALAALSALALLALVGWWFGPWRQPPTLEHVVVRGDTLSKLADQYGVTVAQLRAWNGINGDLIEVDQVLIIHVEAAPTEEAPPRPRAGRRSGAAPATGHGLAMPSPEPCVRLDTAIGDEGMVASAGLDRSQVRSALDPVLPHALGCERDAGVSELAMVFDIDVGCDGVVDGVDVIDGDGASAAYLDCVADVLRHADFPAHDLPDGMRFTYPVSASW